MSFKDKDVQTAQTIFKEQEEKPDHLDYEFKIWKGTFFFLMTRREDVSSSPVYIVGTAHGFAVRPNLEVPDVKEGYEGALDQTVAWFKKTL